ncbi:MAG: ROK family protein [Actinomycetaceae bacterium]|nr:ROK family protein [Actinomycetaceae bacterium]
MIAESHTPRTFPSTSDNIHAARSGTLVAEATRRPVTLSFDFGGSNVKSAVLDHGGQTISAFIQEPVRYPFSPADMLDTIAGHALAHEVDFDRITIGMPGVIRGGKVVTTPHYICPAGPNTPASPLLADQWLGFDVRMAVEERFGSPAIVLNDAQIAAAGVTSGYGAELVLTLGTGLGCAFVYNGQLTPHLEVSHAPGPDGRIFDDYIGEAERLRIGDERWSEQVLSAIDALGQVYYWDRLYVGGGNSFKLTDSTRNELLSRSMPSAGSVTFLPYESGAVGGHKVWVMQQ